MTKEEKLEYIIQNYTKLMHQKANLVLQDSYEAEDACQEAFLKLYRVLDRVSDVTTPEARSYCVMTAKNAAIDLLRKNRRTVPVEEVYDEAASIVDEYPSDTVDMLHDIEELPDKYKNVIRLRCFEELSAEDTAKELDTNVNTVNIRLLRARKILRSKWLAGAVSVVIVVGITYLFLNPVVSKKEVMEMAAAVPEEEIAMEEAAEEVEVFMVQEKAMDAAAGSAAMNGAFAEEMKEMPAAEVMGEIASEDLASMNQETPEVTVEETLDTEDFAAAPELPEKEAGHPARILWILPILGAAGIVLYKRKNKKS